MKKNIKIIEWETEGCTESSYCYRLDEPCNGDRFFRDLLNNAESDGREKFTIKEVTPKQWAQIERNGQESS
jgi:hypothetical protein